MTTAATPPRSRSRSRAPGAPGPKPPVPDALAIASSPAPGDVPHDHPFANELREYIRGLDAERAIPASRKALDAAHAERERVVAEQDALVKAAAQAHDRLGSARVAGAKAKAELLRRAILPADRDRLLIAKAHLSAARDELARLNRDARELPREIRDLRDRIERPPTRVYDPVRGEMIVTDTRTPEQLRDELDHKRAVLDDIQRRTPEVERAVDAAREALDRAEREAIEHLLTPGSP